MNWIIEMWRRIERRRKDQWRHVPAPEWKAKRGGWEYW